MRQVTSGCRVVAVYNVLGRPRKELAPVPPLQEPSGATPEQPWSYCKLVKMLSEPRLTRALQASGYHRVGFLLHHEYNFDTRYGYQEPYRMPLSELMGRDRVLYEAALAAGHSVVQVEQCTLRHELARWDRDNFDGYNYRWTADDLGRVRVARSTMDAHELVKDGGPTVYEWLYSIQYDLGNIAARCSLAEWKQAQARKFEVPDRMKPYVGADTITPEEASFVCRQIDFDDYSDPSEGFIHNVNDVYWPFRDVWWACSDSSIKRQFDATKKFASTPSGRGGYSGEFGYPLSVSYTHLTLPTICSV